MGQGKKVINNTIYLYIRAFISMFISLYTTRVILDALGVSDFGIFNVIGGAIALLGFLNGSMASTTQRFISYSEGQGDEIKKRVIFNVSLIIHFFIAFLVVVALIIFGFLYFDGILNIPEERYHAAIIVYAALVISTTITVVNAPFDALINAHENMKFYAIIGVVESIIKLAVAYICLYSSHDKLIMYGILMAAIPVFTCIVIMLYCWHYYSECVISPKQYYDKNTLKDIQGFAGWNLLSTSSQMAFQYGGNIIINHFFGVVVNAAMGIVNQVHGQLLFFSNNMEKALRPVVVKSEGSGNRRDMLKWAFTGCRFEFMILAFVTYPIIVEAPYILSLWLKDVPDYTVTFLRFQIIRSLLEFVTASVTAMLAATGNIRESSIQNSIIYGLALLVLYISFRLYGFPPYIFFVIMIVFSLSNSIFKLRLTKKYCSLRYADYVKKVAFPLIFSYIASLFIGVGITFIFKEGIVRLFLSSFAMWLSYLFIIWFSILSHEEKDTLLSYSNLLFIKKNICKS